MPHRTSRRYIPKVCFGFLQGFPSILFLFVLNTTAQKIYYAPGNENWEQNISNEESDLLYTVYLLGDIKYPSPESENLKLLKNYISKESVQARWPPC